VMKIVRKGKKMYRWQNKRSKGVEKRKRETQLRKRKRKRRGKESWNLRKEGSERLLVEIEVKKTKKMTK